MNSSALSVFIQPPHHPSTNVAELVTLPGIRYVIDPTGAP